MLTRVSIGTVLCKSRARQVAPLLCYICPQAVLCFYRPDSLTAEVYRANIPLPFSHPGPFTQPYLEPFPASWTLSIMLTVLNVNQETLKEDLFSTTCSNLQSQKLESKGLTNCIVR